MKSLAPIDDDDDVTTKKYVDDAIAGVGPGGGGGITSWPVAYIGQMDAGATTLDAGVYFGVVTADDLTPGDEVLSVQSTDGTTDDAGIYTVVSGTPNTFDLNVTQPAFGDDVTSLASSGLAVFLYKCRPTGLDIRRFVSVEDATAPRAALTMAATVFADQELDPGDAIQVQPVDATAGNILLGTAIFGAAIGQRQTILRIDTEAGNTVTVDGTFNGAVVNPTIPPGGALTIRTGDLGLEIHSSFNP